MNVCPIVRPVSLPDEYKVRWQDPDTIKKIIQEYKTIAVVGISPKPDRASCHVANYLLLHGFTVIPVNPRETEVLGQKCYPSLEEIPFPVGVVDIFRRPDMVMPIVEAAIKIRAKAVWMQFDVINIEAGELAEKNGLLVVMDKCIKIEHGDVVRKKAP
ncbi:MAG: CoA-binding protein [Candidatus Margulisiibacteriota bacterium]|jgi:hypothetical protein